MTQTTNYLAFDLGASGGRVMVGRFDGERLTLEEAHRFPNGPTRLLGSLHWDVLHLFNQMKTGLGKATALIEGELLAFGIDTWGVDFGLLDRSDNLIGNPYHYRDSLTNGMMEKAFELVPREEIFKQTGIQFMQINTLFQLLALAQRNAPALDIADALLMTPDLFNYWFTGQKANEYTIASTSQCYNMSQGRWATALLEKLGLPTHIFGEVIRPGAQLGPLLPALAEEIGASNEVQVIAPGCHDTTGAVAAVPVAKGEEDHFAYISSGTWSLVGVERSAPVIDSKSLAYNFTNEGGVENTIRLLKNLGGLWLLQECRRTWAQGGQELSYDELTQLARQVAPFAALIDPDDASFLAPGDMPARLREFCARTGQTPPANTGEFVRVVLEGLALKYRWVIERLEEMTGQSIKVVHIVGGGTQNRLLNQFAANATGRPVITGPVEATAIGNILMQMLSMGQIGSLSEGREIVRRSFPVETYHPENVEIWYEAYRHFAQLLQI